MMLTLIDCIQVEEEETLKTWGKHTGGGGGSEDTKKSCYPLTLQQQHWRTYIILIKKSL